MAKFDAHLKCSFCGKSQDQVRKLIAGPGVYICDECIDLCNEILDEELVDSHGNPRQNSEPSRKAAPANRKARRPISPEIRLAIRLRILANAFAEPDIQIARMRQRLARLGLIVRKLGPTFPETITTTLLRMGAERSGINLPARLLFDSS